MINKIDQISKKINQFKEKIRGKFNKEDQNKILSALDLTIELHSDQEDRPDGRPYINHPLEIASDLVEKYEVKDRNLIIAALLHDAVEDQSLKLSKKRMKRMGLIEPKDLEIKSKKELKEDALQEISFLYGDKVEKLLGSLSNPDFDSLIAELKLKGIEKSKNELYKEHVEEVIKDPDICVIKYADFARNALAVGNIQEEIKKVKLIKKYGPVIKEVFLPAFRTMSENHPLYNKRKAIIQELKRTYKELFL